MHFYKTDSSAQCGAAAKFARTSTVIFENVTCEKCRARFLVRMRDPFFQVEDWP